jgi:hypothetical protein
VHSALPAATADVYGGHATHVEDEAAPSTTDAVPAGHCVHDATLTPPSVSKYVPMGHAVHALLPCGAYLPAWQMVHVEARLAPTTPDE